jgi:hypothetical protein
MGNFFIRGCSELCDVDFDEFNLLFLSNGIVLRFCHGISKNQKNKHNPIFYRLALAYS